MSEYSGSRAKRAAIPGGTSSAVIPLKIGLVLTLGLGLVLAGCSSKRSAFRGTGSPTYKKSGPVPQGGGVYKVGKPYQIAGRWYYPQENRTYDRTGIASWYGPKFHRRMTSNGEWFDMNRLSAAHPTLPLPSYVRVTNLSNGRALIVRVNDRGPYADGRVIDLSKQAASMLGYIRNGTAQVRVQYVAPAPLEGSDPRIEDENRRLMARYNGNSRALYTASIGNPSPSAASGGQMISPAAIRSGDVRHYVQIAAYARQRNARQALDRVAEFGNARMIPTQVGAQLYHRVRIGPFADLTSAATAKMRVIALGYRDARIINAR